MKVEEKYVWTFAETYLDDAQDGEYVMFIAITEDARCVVHIG